MSSSGLVLPLAASARDGQPTSKVARPDAASSTVPEPAIRDPTQWALAVRTVVMLVAPRVGDETSTILPAVRNRSSGRGAHRVGDNGAIMSTSAVPTFYDAVGGQSTF